MTAQNETWDLRTGYIPYTKYQGDGIVEVDNDFINELKSFGVVVYGGGPFISDMEAIDNGLSYEDFYTLSQGNTMNISAGNGGVLKQIRDSDYGSMAMKSYDHVVIEYKKPTIFEKIRAFFKRIFSWN
jgi:hypothetical protein